MELRQWWGRLLARRVSEPAQGSVLANAMSHRTFLKVVVAAVTGVGVGQLTRPAPTAEAEYTEAPPEGTTDSVDRNLKINGDLLVVGSTQYGDGRIGIGTDTPQGKLDVMGDIRVNGTVAIASDGVIMKSYYAP